VIKLKSINQVTLLGNLTREPELRYTPSGNAVIGFSIATNRQWLDKETKEKKEAVDYHDIVFWGKSAEIISQFVGKGSKILVQGRLQTRSWEKEGIKHYKTEIVGDEFILFDKKQGTEPTATEGQPTEVVAEPEMTGTKSDEVNPNDIPF
jgi:single-strand DNA-binding protein